MTPHEQKTDKILDTITEMKVELARFIVHQDNHANDIKELMEYKEKDKELKNRAIGGLAVFNIALAAVGSWLAKHL